MISTRLLAYSPRSARPRLTEVSVLQALVGLLCRNFGIDRLSHSKRFADKLGQSVTQRATAALRLTRISARSAVMRAETSLRGRLSRASLVVAEKKKLRLSPATGV